MSALGKLFEGTAWFATLSLATVGALTFVPDGAWATFPGALRPVRAKLAEFGVAPSCYRVDSDGGEAQNGDAKAGEVASNGKTRRESGGLAGGDDWTKSTKVRVGERWKIVPETRGATAFGVGGIVGNGNEGGARPLGVENVASVGQAGAGNATDDENGALASANVDDGDWDEDSIPPFVEEFDERTAGGDASLNVESEGVGSIADAAVVGTEAGAEVAEAAVVGTETGAEVAEAAVVGTEAGAEVAPIANASSGNASDGFSGFNGFNASAPLLAQADAALSNGLGEGPGVVGADLGVGAPGVVGSDLNVDGTAAGGGVASGDDVAELRDALDAAATASTAEEIGAVFVKLNDIRSARGARLTAEEARALDAALDRLAFEVFYNPAQAILEPFWQTASGESLASIAERLGTTPETLAEINGVKTPVDAPLPVGTTLKTIRGPVSAEISVAKKELTLRFNGLYAGRFALGVPESSANLRGDFRVVEKLANPNCDAVDANGQTISIPGGAPENPLGVAWIALDAGVGLQGTNRPELVGQTVRENGGFIFSNREIAQLSVLLPVGAVVAIVD